MTTTSYIAFGCWIFWERFCHPRNLYKLHGRFIGKDDVSCITLDVISCPMFPKSGGNFQTKIPVGEILEALGDACFVGGRVSRDRGYPEEYDMPAICKWCGHCGPWTCWRYFCEVDEVCWWSCRRPRSRRLSIVELEIREGSNWQRIEKKRCETCGKESRLRACKHIIGHGVKLLVFKKRCWKSNCCAWVSLAHFILRYFQNCRQLGAFGWPEFE